MAQDKRAGRRLFLELPALTSAVRSWVLVGVEPMFTTQRGLGDRLGHLAAKLGRLPSLPPSLASQQRAEQTTARLIAAHSQRAVEALGAAWAAVETVPPNEPPSVHSLALLEEAVRRLELAVQRRHQPCFEFQE